MFSNCIYKAQAREETGLGEEKKKKKIISAMARKERDQLRRTCSDGVVWIARGRPDHTRLGVYCPPRSTSHWLRCLEKEHSSQEDEKYSNRTKPRIDRLENASPCPCQSIKRQRRPNQSTVFFVRLTRCVPFDDKTGNEKKNKKKRTRRNQCSHASSVKAITRRFGDWLESICVRACVRGCVWSNGWERRASLTEQTCPLPLRDICTSSSDRRIESRCRRRRCSLRKQTRIDMWNNIARQEDTIDIRRLRSCLRWTEGLLISTVPRAMLRDRRALQSSTKDNSTAEIRFAYISRWSILISRLQLLLLTGEILR